MDANLNDFPALAALKSDFSVSPDGHNSAPVLTRKGSILLEFSQDMPVRAFNKFLHRCASLHFLLAYSHIRAASASPSCGFLQRSVL